MRPTLYEFAGGEKAFMPFAAALHARCLADPELNHPFSHPGQNPQHVERLAAYLAEAMGGPPRYSGEYGGDQTALVLLHAGNGDMSDLGRRFADCFMGAADDAGWPDDPQFRAAIRGYIERSVDVVALSHPNDTDIPADLPIPHWSWDGPSELSPRKSKSAHPERSRGPLAPAISRHTAVSAQRLRRAMTPIIVFRLGRPCGVLPVIVFQKGRCTTRTAHADARRPASLNRSDPRDTWCPPE